MTTQFPLGPWTEAGNSVYAQTPQNVDHSRFRGFSEQETHGGEEVGYLIAESIPCDATRRLITASPDLLDACTQILAALDTDDAEELANGYESARLAVANAKGRSP